MLISMPVNLMRIDGSTIYPGLVYNLSSKHMCYSSLSVVCLGLALKYGICIQSLMAGMDCVAQACSPRSRPVTGGLGTKSQR